MSSFNKMSLINNLNNKNFIDLNENLRRFIFSMFPNIKEQDTILCREFLGSKINILITVNGFTKNISVRNGDIVCVYKGYICKLVLFLKSIHVSFACILSLLHYHYADGTYDGSGNSVKSFGHLLSVDYKNEISIVEKEFQDLNKLEKVLDYVLFNEKNGKRVDYFYFGDAKKGIFSSAIKVKHKILEEKNKYHHNFMRIGVMNFLPLKRNLLFVDRFDEMRHICLLRINLKKYVKK